MVEKFDKFGSEVFTFPVLSIMKILSMVFGKISGFSFKKWHFRLKIGLIQKIIIFIRKNMIFDSKNGVFIRKMTFYDEIRSFSL